MHLQSQIYEGPHCLRWIQGLALGTGAITFTKFELGPWVNRGELVAVTQYSVWLVYGLSMDYVVPSCFLKDNMQHFFQCRMWKIHGLTWDYLRGSPVSSWLWWVVLEYLYVFITITGLLSTIQYIDWKDRWVPKLHGFGRWKWRRFTPF